MATKITTALITIITEKRQREKNFPMPEEEELLPEKALGISDEEILDLDIGPRDCFFNRDSYFEFMAGSLSFPKGFQSKPTPSGSPNRSGQPGRPLST
jgi:hypothetical protein